MEQEIKKATDDLASALIAELNLKSQEKDIKIALISAHKDTLQAKDSIRALEIKI